MSRRARSRATAVAAKYVALVPLDEREGDDEEDREDEDYSGGPSCPRCGAEVAPEHDECWMCGEEL